MSWDYKYAEITNIRTITIKTKKNPLLEPNDVLIKIYYCGVCGTDLAIYTGKRETQLLYTPGNEYCGVIIEKGNNVDRYNIGDLVTANPNYICRNCYYCKKKLFLLCDLQNYRFFSNGAFAEYLSIDSTYVYKKSNKGYP